MAVNYKQWVDQCEYDDEEDLEIQFVRDSAEEGEMCSGDEETVFSPNLPKVGSSSKLGSSRRLNATAPEFIPNIEQQQRCTKAESKGKAIAKKSGQQQQLNSTTVAEVVTESGQQQQLIANKAAGVVTESF